jgi:uncharacterized protein YjiS (DUF1127 family)
MRPVAFTTARPSARPGPGPRLWIWHILGLMRQRRDLARMDDRMLADIGVTRSEAMIEAGRPIWDVPQHWLR